MSNYPACDGDKPDDIFTVKYIAISGGKQTAENVKAHDLLWFIEHTRKIISIVNESS